MTLSFKTGLDPMDFDTVTQWLRDTYWSPGITKEEVVFGASNSTLVVGGFDEHGKQVSYMRVLSDKVRFAYLMDVIVDPLVRKRGIGSAMVRFAMERSEFSLVYTWLLRTVDAQGVYEKLGFEKVVSPEDWMTHSKPRGDRSVFKA
jgi:ribosomal protein S18 acetylase RimI-like enzyme